MHPHARALNRRSPYLCTLQTLCQPPYPTHLLKQLTSEAPTGTYSPTITTPSALIMGRNRQPKPLNKPLKTLDSRISERQVAHFTSSVSRQKTLGTGGVPRKNQQSLGSLLQTAPICRAWAFIATLCLEAVAPCQLGFSIRIRVLLSRKRQRREKQFPLAEYSP